MPQSQGDEEAQHELLYSRLLDLASKRAHPKTLCPSEVARSFSATELQQDLDVATWRDLVPRLRHLCFELRDQGELEILQKGEVLDQNVAEDDVRGPIRIRLSKAAR